MTFASVAASLWTAANLPTFGRYYAAVNDPRSSQEAILRHYLRDNEGTAFGRVHGFGAIRTVAEYQDRVPLSRWADVAPWVDRIAGGESNVLTRSRVRVLE